LPERNTESIVMVNYICNRAGLDTNSSGSIIAFAIELYENGILTQQDTDGIDLRWGNHRSIVAMTRKLGESARASGCFWPTREYGVRNHRERRRRAVWRCTLAGRK